MSWWLDSTDGFWVSPSLRPSRRHAWNHKQAHFLHTIVPNHSWDAVLVWSCSLRKATGTMESWWLGRNGIEPSTLKTFPWCATCSVTFCCSLFLCISLILYHSPMHTKHTHTHTHTLKQKGEEIIVANIDFWHPQLIHMKTNISHWCMLNSAQLLRRVSQS